MFTQPKRRRSKRRGRSLAPALIIESLALFAFAWWVLQWVPAPAPLATSGTVATDADQLWSESRLESPKIGDWLANQLGTRNATQP